MELVDRVARIMRAKTSGLLSEFENDPRVIDETIVDAKKELASLRATAKAVYANEKDAKDDLAEYEEKAALYMKAAENAVLQGNDEDAQKALDKSAEFQEKVEKQKGVVARQIASADALRAKVNKMVENIKDMEDVAAEVKSDMANAKAAKASATLTGGTATASFDRIAETAARKRAEAEALAEMSDDDNESDAEDDLLKKYGAKTASGTTLDELKARLGK